jgi:hypothetical protein
MDIYSDDDLDWLCGWGEGCLIKWETLESEDSKPFESSDPAIVMMVDHWMWLASFYVSMSYAGWDLSNPEILHMLHRHVESLRMKSDYCRLHGFPYLRPP